MDVNIAPTIQPPPKSATTAASAKTLKRCMSVPIIMTTRSAARSAESIASVNKNRNSVGGGVVENMQETPKKCQNHTSDSTSCIGNFAHNIHINIPRSNPNSREVSPAPAFNIFSPRVRRYSASYSPMNATTLSASNVAAAPLCVTPRVSQLRQEECVDMNSREVNHEREVHSAIQMSQSWEDLTLVAENWSCKSDELSNPLQVVLPSGIASCSSPSPTSNRAGLRLPYGLSPSPTRRTFATRRSMSPIAMRPSQLGPVKRKFDMDDNNSSNWNVYSPPPLKKIFTDSRGSSPICQSPSSACASPDSGTYDGRATPKLFISKLCTTNTNNSSACSSPSSSSVCGMIDTTATSAHCSSSSSSSSSASSISNSNSEPMCVGSNNDEGISISEPSYIEKAVKLQSALNMTAQPISNMCTDMQDDITLMDDMKSETSSESTSCDSGGNKVAATTFLNKLIVDEANVALSLGQKNFFINKQGHSGAKKFIVNHDNLANSSSEHMDCAVSTTIGAKMTRCVLGRVSLQSCQDSDDMEINTAAEEVTASVIVENKV